MPGAPTSRRSGTGRALSSRDGRGIHKQTSEASREARERVNRLKRTAQADGSRGRLLGADYSGQTTRGRLLGADYSGQTQTGGRGAGRRWGPKRLTPLRLAFESNGVFFKWHYHTIQRYKKFSIYANFSGLFFGLFFGFFRVFWCGAAKPPWVLEGGKAASGPAKPAEGRQSRLRGGKAASCYMGHVM